MSLNKNAWQGFLNICLVTKTNKELEQIFEIFLTSEEKENLALRYAIVRELLKQEKTQRQIAKDLNVSIAKITRGSNELKRLPAKLKEYLKKNLE